MYAIGSYLTTVVDCGATMAFALIDAVRNLRSRSNRVRTARLTPPQGYDDAWRRLVQRNAAQRVQQCVSQRGKWCAVAGHRRRPAWCALHCHSSGDSSGGESGARLHCCALLPQPSAPHSSQIFAGVACLLAAEEALLHAPAASTTCPQGSSTVDAADLQGERALRPAQVRHWDRTVQVRRAPPAALASESPKGARSRATAPEHGTAISTKAPLSLYSCR